MPGTANEEVIVVQVLLIIASGLVSAGIVRGAWQLIAQRHLGFAMLLERGVMAPVTALAVAASAPVLLIESGLFARDGDNSLGVELLFLAAALATAFVQGVVVLVGLGYAG